MQQKRTKESLALHLNASRRADSNRSARFYRTCFHRAPQAVCLLGVLLIACFAINLLAFSDGTPYSIKSAWASNGSFSSVSKPTDQDYSSSDQENNAFSQAFKNLAVPKIVQGASPLLLDQPSSLLGSKTTPESSPTVANTFLSIPESDADKPLMLSEGAGATAHLCITASLSVPEYSYGYSSCLYYLYYDYADDTTCKGTLYIEPNEALGLKAGDTFRTSTDALVKVGEEHSFEKPYGTDYWVYDLPEGAKFTVKHRGCTPFESVATLAFTANGSEESSRNGEFSGTIKKSESVNSESANRIEFKYVPSVQFVLKNNFVNQDNLEVAGSTSYEYLVKLKLQGYNKENPITFNKYNKAGEVVDTFVVAHQENEEYSEFTCTLDEGEFVAADSILFATPVIVNQQGDRRPGIDEQQYSTWMSENSGEYTGRDSRANNTEFYLGEKSTMYVADHMRVNSSYLLGKKEGARPPYIPDEIGGGIFPVIPMSVGEIGYSEAGAPLSPVGEGESGGDTIIGQGGEGALTDDIDTPLTEEEEFANAQPIRAFSFYLYVEPDNVYLKKGDVIKASVAKRMFRYWQESLVEVLEGRDIVVGEDNWVTLSTYGNRSDIFQTLELDNLPAGTVVTAYETFDPGYFADVAGEDVRNDFPDRLEAKKIIRGSDEGYAIVNAVTFYNDSVPQTLTVQKRVSGDTVNPDDRFEVNILYQTKLGDMLLGDRVRLVDKEDNPIDGTQPENANLIRARYSFIESEEYKSIEVSENGVAWISNQDDIQVRLRDGDKIIIQNVEYKSSATVSENPGQGYTAQIYDAQNGPQVESGTTYTFEMGSDKTIEVHNTQQAAVSPDDWGVLLPSMGTDNPSSFPLVGLILLGFGAVGTLLFRTRDTLSIFEPKKLNQ